MQEITAASAAALFDYYKAKSSEIPFWHPVPYDLWLRCVFDDTDSERQTLFDDLSTCAAFSEDELLGYIQYGRPAFLFGPRGEKISAESAGIIRSFHYGSPDAAAGEALIAHANAYFDRHKLERRWAFFHAFGMSCHARHGKLFQSAFHMEDLLLQHRYIQEHENVYYQRSLTEEDKAYEGPVTVVYGDISGTGFQKFDLTVDKKLIGGGDLHYLPQGDICHLVWIHVNEQFQGRGYAGAGLRKLLADLARQGLTRIDTDTADTNFIAQSLYQKAAFAHMGRTRSYIIVDQAVNAISD